MLKWNAVTLCVYCPCDQKELWWFPFSFNVWNQRFNPAVLAPKEVNLRACVVSGIADVQTRDAFIVIKLYFSLEGSPAMCGLAWVWVSNHELESNTHGSVRIQICCVHVFQKRYSNTLTAHFGLKHLRTKRYFSASKTSNLSLPSHGLPASFKTSAFPACWDWLRLLNAPRTLPPHSPMLKTLLTGSEGHSFATVRVFPFH